MIKRSRRKILNFRSLQFPKKNAEVEIDEEDFYVLDSMLSNPEYLTKHAGGWGFRSAKPMIEFDGDEVFTEGDEKRIVGLKLTDQFVRVPLTIVKLDALEDINFSNSCSLRTLPKEISVSFEI